MQQRRPHVSGIYFTGVPLNVDAGHLRKHFESIGHVLEFRLLGPTPGKDFRFGLVDYADDKTAEEAISRLNGTMFGERPMRVTVANMRTQHSNSGSGGGPNAMRGKRRREPHGTGTTAAAADGEGTRDVLHFPRSFCDPALGREDSVVLNCVRGMRTQAAYEAVEQLRVLALERRHEARLLLLENPALRSAVVMILQHAGRLPMSNLPAAAFQSAEPLAATAAQREAQAQTAAKGSATQSSKGISSVAVQPTTEEQRDEVLQIIANMSEADVERVATMSDADLLQVPDPSQRKQLEILRDRLLEMTSEL